VPKELWYEKSWLIKFFFEKYYSKEKKEKKKVPESSGGKMRCNIFLKKIWT